MGPYARPALVPAMPWLGATQPASPILRRTAGGLRIEGPAAAARWVVWRRVGGIWRFEVQAAQDRDLDAAGASAFAVATVDRLGNLSEVQVMHLP
jgi:hypothetical protein